MPLHSKEGYNLWAADYTGSWPEFFEGNKIISLLGDLKGKRVLDAGCGTGRNLVKLLAAGAVVTGVDISPNMILESQKVLQQKGFVAELRVAPLDSLPFPDQSFDIILASSVLDHIKNLKTVLSEFVRLLRPGGKLVIAGPHQECDLTIHQARFTHKGQKCTIEEYPHTFQEIEGPLEIARFHKIHQEEMGLSENHRKMYALDVFAKEQLAKVYMILIFQKSSI